MGESLRDGIGLTPDEKEIWLCDAFNEYLHIFDVTVMPPKMISGVKVHDEPGWVTFSLDGKFAYPSTGDIIEVASRAITGRLTDETETAVQSEKMLEIQWQGAGLLKVRDQFGVGRLATRKVPAISSCLNRTAMPAIVLGSGGSNTTFFR